MQKTITSKHIIWDNIMWFVGSMALAFLVWVIASLQSDPVQERVFRTISVQIEHDAGLLVTDQTRDTVSVTVRSPKSVLDQLNNDDLEVRADMTGLGPGTHRINLEPRVSRRGSADTSPRQIMITLEEASEQFKPITTLVTTDPPAGYEIAGEGPTVDASQVLVSGPLSKVDQVTSARISLNLGQQRTTLEGDYRLLPVDVDDNPVNNVTLDPATVHVTVQIQPRPDIREVRVTPNILAETLPEGYALTEISYDPQSILVSGTPDRLADAPGTFFTQPIDLSRRTANFEQDVAVQIPDENLFVVGGQDIHISIGITPLISSRQFDRIPVEIIGLEDGAAAAIVPDEVTVLISGPQLMLQELAAEDLRVVVDLNGLQPGAYQIQPEVSISQVQTTQTNLSVLPEQIDIVITGDGEATETPTPP